MSKERRVLIALTLFALVLRVAWVLSLSRTGFAFNDAKFYDSSARTLLHGHGFLSVGGYPTAQWPPGYSTALAGVYGLFGENPRNGELFNALCSAACVPLLYYLVRPNFGRRVATIAAVILCIAPGMIFWTDVLVTESLVTMLFLGFFLLAVRSRPTWAWGIGLGAYVGLGVMVRGEAPVWLLIPLVLWWRRSGWKISLSRVGLAVVALAVMMTPWTVRNYAVHHAFVPLSLNSSNTLWSGHNPKATGAQTYPTNELNASLIGSATGSAAELALANGLRHEALHFMITHPVVEFSLIPRKIVALLRGDSHAFEWINQPPYPALDSDTTWFVGTLGDAVWYSVLGLCLVGVFGLGRRLWRTPLMVAIATSLATALVTYGFAYYGNYRYHIPYEPLMMVVAALVIDRGWQGIVAARTHDVDPMASTDDTIDDPIDATIDDPMDDGPIELRWSPGGESNS